jgi:hypothetical protein
VDSTDLQGVGRVQRQDSAVAAFKLGIDDGTDSGGGEQQQEEEYEAATKHSRRLLATTAWKSKRLVSTGRDE